MYNLDSLAERIRSHPDDRAAQLAYADLCEEMGMSHLAEKLRRLGQLASLATSKKKWKVLLFAAIPHDDGATWTYQKVKDLPGAFKTKEAAREKAEVLEKETGAKFDALITEGQVFWDATFS